MDAARVIEASWAPVFESEPEPCEPEPFALPEPPEVAELAEPPVAPEAAEPPEPPEPEPPFDEPAGAGASALVRVGSVPSGLPSPSESAS